MWPRSLAWIEEAIGAPSSTLPLRGRHATIDAALGVAAALLLVRTPDEIAHGFASFEPPKGRLAAETWLVV
jgi:hypothetical protein